MQQQLIGYTASNKPTALLVLDPVLKQFDLE
jgi:hypothetical protein